MANSTLLAIPEALIKPLQISVPDARVITHGKASVVNFAVEIMDGDPLSNRKALGDWLQQTPTPKPDNALVRFLRSVKPAKAAVTIMYAAL